MACYPETASILDKYRVNPGNVGSSDNKNFTGKLLILPKNNNKAIRIGGNWGSLSRSYLEKTIVDGKKSDNYEDISKMR